MKTLKLTLLLLAVCCTLLASLRCKKKEEIRETRDLKTLSLPELKSFLKGRWQYSISSTIAGKHTEKSNGANRFLVFYSDSVQMNNENGVFLREKLNYQYRNLPGTNGVSANVLLFGYDGLGWVADKLKNDTLVFADYFSSEGISTVYYTKER